MNMATIIVKQLKKQGLLKEIDESEEINACSIVVDVDVNGKDEPWLIMFKTKLITTRQKSSLSAVRQLVLAVLFVTRFQEEVMYIRLCV